MLRLWLAVAVACAVATPVGYALMDITSSDFQGGINGFAAGALLVMLVTTLGFAVGAALSFN